MNPGNFFGELKRRNVYKVAVAYIVGGWALSQGIAQVLPVFDVPNWVIRLLVALVIIGFPIALIFAWAFEITPEGVKRAEDVDVNKPHTVRGPWIYIVLAGVAVSVGLFLLGRYTAPNRTATSDDNKSIAVLPFATLSDDRNDAYFADGVQDQILTNLAKVSDLKVISHTSVRQYKTGAERNLREIGQQLGVAYIMEGSVQRARDRLRINAELIDARTDAHIWAETYDRTAADLFAIQSELAQSIATQLRAKLSPEQKAEIEQRPTQDLDAFELYIQAKAVVDSYVPRPRSTTRCGFAPIQPRPISRGAITFSGAGVITIARLKNSPLPGRVCRTARRFSFSRATSTGGPIIFRKANAISPPPSPSIRGTRMHTIFSQTPTCSNAVSPKPCAFMTTCSPPASRSQSSGSDALQPRCGEPATADCSARIWRNIQTWSLPAAKHRRAPGWQ